MNVNKFISELKEILEVDEEITIDTSLENMDEYDSLAIMSLVAFIDENFDMTVSGESLGEIKTVSDLIALICPDKIN